MSDELWDAPDDASDFALPGDDQRLARVEAGEGAAAAVAEPSTETPAEAEPGERVRDEQGRFAKKETSEEPDEAQPVEGEAAEETAAEAAARLLAGKYKTPEELERAHLEAQALIDRQGNEVGELRQQIQRLYEWQQRQSQAPTDWEALIDENPVQAAQLAYQQQNLHAYRAAVDAWEDVSPGTPAVWYQNMRLQQQMEAAQQHQWQQQWNESVAQFARDNPGIEEIPMEDLLAAGQRNPVFMEMIQRATNPEARLGALRVLYLEAEQARGRKSDTLVSTAQDIARVQQAETQRAKEEGILASATANMDGGPKPSVADQIGAQWDEIDRPMVEGWNI